MIMDIKDLIVGYAIGQTVTVILLYFGYNWYSFKRARGDYPP
jgi:hypothetical protein